MNPNLMDGVKGMLTSETLGKAAEATGESPESTRRGMLGAVTTVFAGLTQGASTPGGAARLFGAVTKGGVSGTALLSTVFGDRSRAVSDALAQGSGVKSGSASHMLSLAFPMVAGMLGKYVLSNRLNASGFSQLLFSHKKAILDDPNAPPGLASALGMGNLSELGGASSGVQEPHVTSVSEPAPPERAVTERRTGAVTERRTGIEARSVGPATRRPRWGAIVPAALLAGFAIWGISALASRHTPHVGVTAPQPTAPPVPTLNAPAHPTLPEAPRVPEVRTPTAGPITLPGGRTLDVEASSPEADMARYLGDASEPLPQTFQLDKLNFQYGTATVTPDSADTIDHLATLLQAYPSARVRIEGHTDNAGNPAGNQALSVARAAAIKKMLVAKGIAGDRIEASGKGEQGTVAGNQSNEGRALNRRADIVLLNR
jgi:outer membrane protein OmpA-like peptidoglycan-associated protein